MTRSLLPVLLAASVAVAAPVPKAVVKDYFPLRVGHKWEYVNPDGTASHTEEVTAAEEKDGATVYTVTRSRGGKEMLATVFRVNAEGVARVRQGPLEYDPPIFLLKPGMRADDKWVAKVTLAKREQEFEWTVGRAEEVNTPAGTFTAVPVRQKNLAAKAGQELVYWYSADVGLIRSCTAGNQLVTELKAFTPAKEGKR